MASLKEQFAKKKQQKQQQHPKKPELFNLSLEYHQQGNEQLAIETLTQFIELNPNSAEAYYLLGVWHIDLKEYELALKIYDKVIELNPNLADAYTDCGYCYSQLKKDELALANYDTAIKLDSNNYMAYTNRGIYYKDLGKYDLALADLNKAIKLSPNYINAYFGRGACYDGKQNYELALSDYNKAIQLSPNYYLAYFNRGTCYLNLKKYDLALTDFNKAIQLNFNHADAYVNRGVCYTNLGKYDLALADYNKAIQLNPNDYEAYCGRANYYTELEKYDLALSDYNEAIQLNPNFVDAYHNRSICHLKLENNDAAVNDYLKSRLLEDESLNEYHSTIAKKVELSKEEYDKLLGTIAKLEKEKEIAQKIIEEKNKQLDEKNKELNNLIAMFAHNFLGTLQCIRSNAEHDNNPKIHLKTVKMMSGALTAFSIISANDDKLIEQLKQDNKGDTTLLQNLANNLSLAVSQLLSKTNKDKIINLYLNYLRKTNQITAETDGEDLRFNDDAWEKWNALQQQWEDEFNALFSEKVDLSQLQNWLEKNFFPVHISGFNDYTIRFKEFGITDSIFLVVFMELLVNALKYMDVSQHQPLTITLCKQDQHYQLTCENPSAQESYRGTHKGMDFLKSIAKKINGQFISESTAQSFKSTFIIPAELLE